MRFLICHGRKDLLILKAFIIIQLIADSIAHICPIIVYSLWLDFLGVARRDCLVGWCIWVYVAWLLGLSIVGRVLTSLVLCEV